MPRYTSSYTNQRLLSQYTAPNSAKCFPSRSLLFTLTAAVSRLSGPCNGRDQIWKWSRQCILNAPKETENVKKWVKQTGLYWFRSELFHCNCLQILMKNSMRPWGHSERIAIKGIGYLSCIAHILFTNLDKLVQETCKLTITLSANFSINPRH